MTLNNCSVRDKRERMLHLPHIPLKLKYVWDPGSASASCPRHATADDGLDYVIKHDEGGIPVRANEWCCTHIARSVGIAVPAFALIEDTDGALLFGSQMFGDGSSINDNSLIFAQDRLPDGFVEQISKTYALDIFISNFDRHINNYLVRSQNGRDRLLSFDFGWSFFRGWPNSLLPLPRDCATITNRYIISNLWGVDLGCIESTLDNIASLPDSFAQSLVSGMPDDWLELSIRKEFVDWWSNGGRNGRIAHLRSEVNNGNL